MVQLVTQRTLHTYVGELATCRKARRWLSDRSILSKTETIKRGHHRFTLHVPVGRDEAWARKTLATALGDVSYEPFVWTEEEKPAAGSIPKEGQPPAGAPRVDMREYVRERCDVIVSYAEDGAYRTALQRTEELAAKLRDHVAMLGMNGL